MKTYIYLLCDDNGVSNSENEILLPIGTRFRHEFGFYTVGAYVNDKGNVETRFSHISMVWCDRERN